MSDADELVQIVTNNLRPGATAVFSVLRGGKRLDVPVAVGERPALPSSG